MRTAVFFLTCLVTLASADLALDEALDAVAPGLAKWGTFCMVKSDAEGRPDFEWHDYRGTGMKQDFWPASTIKLYAAIAACELLHEHGLGLDATATFHHQERNGKWVTDAARTPAEMISEVFRRSSNEDYTLLLRLCGIDRVNTAFLTPERGFPRSALMRGYVSARPWMYGREEAQRIRLSAADSSNTLTLEHHWGGRFYAEERGCTIIDAKTGNVTTTRELCDTLRRVLFHSEIAEGERFRISAEQARFLREGDAQRGFCGLETHGAESGPVAWEDATEAIFPKARFFHKSGLISNYALELACVDGRAQNGPCYLMAIAVNAGHATKPAHGEAILSKMALAIAKWA
ncbi:MAG: hypothetical protein JNG86_21985, partial [Verrucomicrobiaceae bacterium]|nr:hypothetical protein [Verrucomicrobiaceae bacterium]